jgi:autotransporter-associated beta strand protein
MTRLLVTRNLGSKSLATILAGAAAMLLATQPHRAWADTNDWVASTNGTWFAPANWSFTAVPAPTDDASVTNNTTVIIQGATEATAYNLYVENGAVTVGNASAGALTVNGEISVGTIGLTGALTLNAGTISVNTLSVGADGTYTDTSFGTLNLTGANPTIQMAGTVDVVVNSQITGTNGLIKGSIGTLTLAGANTYSGGTVIESGTLRIGNGGTLGNLGAGDVTNNGALVFNRSDTLIVSNTIAGAGTLTQAGPGTTTLVAENTYTGTTFINAGTLQIGDGGTTGSLGTGDVVDNAALAFNRSDDVAFSNTVSGTGNLIQAGTGTLTIVGGNTYSGSTIIASGTLQVGDGGTTGSLGTGNVSNDSVLVFNRSDSVSISNAISGTGSLTQNSSGTLTLVGNNTYTGETIINTGTLQVGDGGTTGTLGGGDVINNSALVFDRSNSILVTNAISGNGTLTQAGTGTLTLAGDSTYSGVTIIETGTVRVGNGGTLGSLGTGDITNNGALVFSRSDTNLVANLIVGTGTLTQVGPGTTALLATNTYTGATIISGGTLQIGDGADYGSVGSGDVTNNAVLAFNRSDTVAFSNLVAGSGALVQAGTGTLILLSSNTYSGRTIVNAGTLQVGDGGTLGSLGTGAVSNNSALVFNHSDDLVVSNAISGTGSLTKNSDNTLTLVGNNTYSGGVLINSGTLQVGAGGTVGTLGGGAVTNNAVLVFNRSNDMLITNQISGSGSLIQAGGNTLILSNVNTFTGGIWINNGGTLAARNSNALGSGDVNVDRGTMKVNLMTLNVDGNYVQSPTGSLEIATGGSNTNGILNIAGSASLGGSLFIVQTNGYIPKVNDTFTLLVASNGVSGTFSNTTASPNLLIAANLTYNPNDVTLTYEQGSFLPFARTPNQRTVARDLDAISSSTSSSSVALIQYLDYLPDPTNNLPKAYDQIAPDELTALYAIPLAGMDAQGNQFLKRANELRAGYHAMYLDLYTSNEAVGNEDQIADRPWGVYVDGLGQFVNIDGDSKAQGYNLTSGGATLGVDRQINKQFVVGGAVSYLSSHAGLTGDGSISADTGLAQIYAVWFQDGLHLESAFGGSITSYNTKRQGLNGDAKGSTDGTGWNALLNGGYDWKKDSWSFGPQVGVQYESVTFDSFTEKGSLAPLKYELQNQDALYTQVGAAVRYRGNVTGTWTYVTPELNLAWRHNYSDSTYSMKSRLASGDGNSFTVDGPDFGSDSFVGNLGMTIQWTAAVSSYINGTLLYGQNGYTAEYFSGGLRIGF